MYHKWWSYDLWFLRYRARQTEFFHILDHFLSFYTPSPSPNNPESQSFQKMKKTPRGIIILQKCTINDNHMIYGLWDMKCTRQNFFVILGHFLLFTPPSPPYQPEKWKFQNKEKETPRDIIISHRCVKNYDRMLYCSWDMARETCNCYFSFWAIFCPFFLILITKNYCKWIPMA